MTRRRLPDRRQSTNYRVYLGEGEQKFHITIGFYDDGTPGDVFCDVGKTPQAVQQITADACILISVALQHGVAAEDLGKSLARFDDGQPYTIIGAICDMLTQLGTKGKEDEDGKSGRDNPRGSPEETP